MLEHVAASDAQVVGVRRGQVLKMPSNLYVSRRVEDRSSIDSAITKTSYFSMRTSSRNSNPISESAEPPPTVSS